MVAVAELYAVIACSAPASAFQVASRTGYVRYVAQTAQTAYIAANRTQLISTLAPAMTAAGAGSIALRAVAGPVGWASLGVTAGLVIAGMVYDAGEIAQVKSDAATAAGVPTAIQVNGTTMPAGSSISYTNCDGGLFTGCLQIMLVPNGMAQENCTGLSAGPPAGWTAQSRQWSSVGGGTAQCYDNFKWTYDGTNHAAMASSVPGQPTTQQVADYLSSLPSTSPLAPESQNQPAGATNPAPAGSSATIDQPVSPGQMPSQVGSASSVPSGASVLDPHAPAPTQTTETQTQTATTSTTTNQDGSTTDTQTATVQCDAGPHDARTFGAVLQEHYAVWSASGLLGTLELLKNLTWPSTLPTYTLHSSILGTFTFDFNAWAGVLAALRTLVIAGAGFVAYRIIFVGGH